MPPPPARLVLVLLLFCVGFLPQCTKSDTTSIPEKSTNPVLKTVMERDPDPVSLQAFNEVITDAYDKHGQFLYEHMRYHFSTVDPKLYLGELKEPMVAAIEAQKLATINKSTDQLRDEYVAEGILTSNEEALLKSLRNTIANIGNESGVTFGKAWNTIREWETTTLSDASISENEKQLALIVASGVRNMLKYHYETVGVDEREDCLFGRKLSCWESAIEKTLLDSLKATLTVLAPILIGGGTPSTTTPSPSTWALIKKAALTSGGIGLAIQVASIYLDDKCKCEEVVEGEPPCSKPAGISLISGDCNQQEQWVQTFGYGTSPGVFSWVCSNGYFPDFGNPALGIYETTATTIDPKIKVHQTNPNIPVTITVGVSCNGNNYIDALPFNLPALVNSPGTLFVTGYVETGVGFEETYFFNGSWLLSQNTILTSSYCSAHGTVVSRTPTSMKVKWNSLQPTSMPVSVTGTIQNQCSNNSAWVNFPVILN